MEKKKQGVAMNVPTLKQVSSTLGRVLGQAPSSNAKLSRRHNQEDSHTAEDAVTRLQGGLGKTKFHSSHEPLKRVAEKNNFT